MAPTPAIPLPVRAFCLLSGGLDSQLAVCVLRDQDIEVHGVTFESPFFEATRGRQAAERLGVPLLVVDFTADILELVRHPPHGFGSHMNPCIDCHARMLRRAGDLMAEHGARFLVTGEVLNERPMSQNRRSLDIVETDSGYSGFVLRPLSALLLPETEPERRGWIRRDGLLGLHGRGRSEQFRLAAHYGLKDFPTPAGGCRLTEPNYARRLRDLRSHEELGDARALRLLRIGRHFRLGPAVKLVVGRQRGENEALEEAAVESDWLLKVEDVPGPSALLSASAGEDQLLLAASICLRYSDLPAGRNGRVTAGNRMGARTILTARASDEAIAAVQIA